MLQQFKFRIRQDQFLQIEVAQGAPEFTVITEHWNAVVADHDTLIGMAVQAGIAGGVVGLKQAVAQDKLAKTGGQWHFCQKRRADLAQLVTQQHIAQNAAIQPVHRSKAVRHACVQVLDGCR